MWQKMHKNVNLKRDTYPENMIQAGHLLFELSHLALGRHALALDRVQGATQRPTFRFKL